MESMHGSSKYLRCAGDGAVDGQELSDAACLELSDVSNLGQVVKGDIERLKTVRGLGVVLVVGKHEVLDSLAEEGLILEVGASYFVSERLCVRLDVLVIHLHRCQIVVLHDWKGKGDKVRVTLGMKYETIQMSYFRGCRLNSPSACAT